MPVYLAYIGVILIWSTTPLAIAWSGEAAGFAFGVASRMVLGLLLLCLIVCLMRQSMQWHYRAKLAYLYGGLGMYTSMTAVYWAAQYIPSGWVSVLFGFTPIFSALLAAWWLQEKFLQKHHLMGMGLGITGLVVMFASSLNINTQAVLGICGVILSSFLHASSAIWVKRVHADLPALVMTTGTLIVATPLFVLTWLLFNASEIPQLLPTLQAAPLHALLAIVYLAFFGSVVGFVLYFYVLKHLDATRVALISLMTPITSLYLGYTLNNERLDMHTILGAALIVLGLALFELGGKKLPMWLPFRP